MNKLPARQARPNPLDALRGIVHAGDHAGDGRVDQHRVQAAGDAGKACDAYHDEHVRGVKAKRIQCDEVWAFCYAKQKNVADAKAAPEGAGDVWTWTALDADQQADLSATWSAAGMANTRWRSWTIFAAGWRTGSNSPRTATRRICSAVEEAFGADIDYAMLVKLYGDGPA